MSNNNNLTLARQVKNDEFYTVLEDIEKELIHYKNHFKGKVVYCNCDDYEHSNFTNYFRDNFEKLGITKLISTCYNPTGKGKIEVVSKGQINRDTLQEDGDFRSEEVIRLLKESDIIVTNPPFSLFREYIAQLMRYDKKFLVVGSMNAITYKEIFPLLKDDKMWIGFNFNKTMEFIMPDTYELKGKAYIDSNGNKHGFVPGISWFTNLDIQKHNDFLDLRGNYYNPEKYPKYDNYDAINVNRVKDIPCDYDGVMGVPITFLGKYNSNQFEILDITRRNNDLYRLKKYTKAEYKNANDLNANATILVNGVPKSVYARILIRNKKYLKK